MAGLPIHVTIGTRRSRPFFSLCVLAERVFSVLATHPRTVAACLMPDHAHWLVAGSEGWMEEVRRLKSYTTRLAWSCGHRGKLWQRSYWDRVVRSEEDLEAVIRYLVANPVRAGLVSNVDDYPYQVSRWSGDGR